MPNIHLQLLHPQLLLLPHVILPVPSLLAVAVLVPIHFFDYFGFLNLKNNNYSGIF